MLNDGSSAGVLTDAEEQRFRAVLFSELGNKIADQGWVRFPAYTPEDRRRLVDVAHRLTTYWGQQVLVEAEDQCRLRLCLAGFEALPETLPASSSQPDSPTTRST
ncbi:hypothetical protein OIE62_00795 [Streptomyces scopuliridis]|uniref:Uncharacterized protein n=1 Tax=Streptomyces scopuliridis TaxID=452529 RepID=A0ACD4ZWB0_9ACTN|nr:hypothetical protein [Streptomyces scopuliridis]WSC02750.1 hypothetical protein OG835_41040 [Streptomyces scopuliridis]WSC03717.1 hypothetical protein OIE62_00795 [Streptomyces scopuliridis]